MTLEQSHVMGNKSSVRRRRRQVGDWDSGNNVFFLLTCDLNLSRPVVVYVVIMINYTTSGT